VPVVPSVVPRALIVAAVAIALAKVHTLRKKTTAQPPCGSTRDI